MILNVSLILDVDFYLMYEYIDAFNYSFQIHVGGKGVISCPSFLLFHHCQ